MFAHAFISRAFLAGTLISIAAGLVGYYLLLRNQVFIGDALSHVAFTGALAGLAFGLDPLLGLFTATVAGSVGMGALGGRARSRDVVVGTFFAWVLGLGVLFLTIYTTSNSSTNGAIGVAILFGSIYGLSLHQAITAAVVSGCVTVLLLGIGRPLLFASVDPDVAAARGLPVRLLGTGFMVLLGVTVGEAVQAVGALLIFGLLVTPAAAAHRLTANPYRALAISAGISVASLWLGLTLSYRFQRLPPSFSIVALAFGVYVTVAAAGAARRRRAGGKAAGRGTNERTSTDGRTSTGRSHETGNGAPLADRGDRADPPYRPAVV